MHAISLIEELVEVEYAALRLAPEQRQAIQSAVEDYLDRRRDDSEQEVRSLTRQRQRLLDERGKLLQAHYADAIPLDLMKSEQDRIGRQLDQIEGRLAAQPQRPPSRRKP